jgi:hypothetical protein
VSGKINNAPDGENKFGLTVFYSLITFKVLSMKELGKMIKPAAKEN